MSKGHVFALERLGNYIAFNFLFRGFREIK